MIQQEKCKLPEQTEFGLKQPLTEDTPSGLAQPCEHQPLLHRLTNKAAKNTHKKQKIKKRGQANARYKLLKIRK